MTTKTASTLARDDRIVIDGDIYRVMDYQPIRCDKHSPGRVGYLLVSETDNSVKRLSCPDTDRIQLAP